MQTDNLNYREVTISDIEKQIDTKLLQRYLESTKMLSQLSKYTKNNGKIYLEFHEEEHAKQFIQENNFKTKIMAKSFNAYFTFMESIQEKRVNKYEVIGVSQEKLRPMYDKYKKYGPSRCIINFQENGKLSYKCQLQFLKQSKNTLESLKQELLPLELIVKPLESLEDPNEFRCSIQLIGFCHIKDPNQVLAQEQTLKQKLQLFLQKVSEQQLSSIELQPQLNQTQPAVKAYFRFKTAELTLAEFQKIRKHLLDLPPSIQSRLFFFQNDSNTFYTLFTIGLLNPKDLPLKQFQEQLLTAFREINQNVVQIIVRPQINKTYTGKIYMKNQESGKQLLFSYNKNRDKIYKFYRPNTMITIDMFQSKQEQKKQQKLQKNVYKMMNHLQNTKKYNQTQANYDIQSMNYREGTTQARKEPKPFKYRPKVEQESQNRRE